MNGILGFSELLLKTLETSPEGREYAQTIFQSGEALLRILDDILDFSRLEAGRLRIEEGFFSPRQLIEEIRSLLAPNAAVKGLGLAAVAEDDIEPFYFGDGGRLRQILLNLVGNAIKFTDRGSVAIHVECLERDADKCRMQFSVDDTGHGIAPERLNQIFDPFVQLDSGSSRRFGGTGLGLSISRRLARLMGGELSAFSEVGKGTEFRVVVPFGRTHGRDPGVNGNAAPLPMSADFALAHPLTILIAEDDRVSLKLILTILRKLGYDPIHAQTGREAVEIFRRERPDCLLMDLQMPDMDGIDASREIRQFEKEQGLPAAYIAMLTANTVPADRERCFEAGASDYLNKPLKRERLIEILRAAGNSVKETSQKSS